MKKQTAQEAFAIRKAQIDEALKRLTEASANNFGVNPDKVTWGHVGDLAEYATLLKRITDMHFREGEHAPEAN